VFSVAYIVLDLHIPQLSSTYPSQKQAKGCKR